jgi:hypothetical protein
MSQPGLEPAAAHQAIIGTCERLLVLRESDSEVTGDDVLDYWAVAAPRHYLAAGNPGAAILFLQQHEGPRAAVAATTPMTTTHLTVPFVRVPIPIQVPQNPYEVRAARKRTTRVFKADFSDCPHTGGT